MFSEYFGKRYIVTVGLFFSLSLTLLCYSVPYLAATWHVFVTSVNPWSQAGDTVLLGCHVAVFAMAAYLLSWFPTMVLTWTTALVFSIPYVWITTLVGKKRRYREVIVGNGKTLAFDILRNSMKTAMTSGQVAGAIVIGLSTISILFLGQKW